MTKFIWCKVIQQQADGLAVEATYITKADAWIGNYVRVKGQDGLWMVNTITSQTIEDVTIKETIQGTT